MHEILSEKAQEFLAKLHRNFNTRRLELLNKRSKTVEKLDFLSETAAIRNDSTWKTASIPQDLQCRWVEITGPTDRKMIINAMNSGAEVFMSDFEDSNSPTWENIIEGQRNLCDTVDGTISFVSPEGKKYTLHEKRAVLFLRPRGWHLNEKHHIVDGQEMSGSLFDFGLYIFHNGKKIAPYFYLPKMESHLEARLWNDVFVFAQKELGIPQGTIRATVLIETIPAAFQMEEILYELREHSAGLNAGRWDYIFSIIKKFCLHKDFSFPDRDQITMTVPFMRAYTQLLVQTCHRRGAQAMGGMAAFIPNKNDPIVTENALKKVREDKLREVNDGFDGTWVAHPGLVSIAHDIFAAAHGVHAEVKVTAQQLQSFGVPNGTVTEEGLRHNVNVALQYLTSWLSGKGAAAIFNLMEDAATAEISRAQVWQWLHSGVFDKAMIERVILEEDEKVAKLYGKYYDPEARQLFEHLVFSKDFVQFLTIPAYGLLP